MRWRLRNNSPWLTGVAAENTLYSAVVESSPLSLDPVASCTGARALPPHLTRSTSRPTATTTGRPYELIGEDGRVVAKLRLLDRAGKLLPDDAPAEQIVEKAFTTCASSLHPVPAASMPLRAMPKAATATTLRSRASCAHRRWSSTNQGTRELG